MSRWMSQRKAASVVAAMVAVGSVAAAEQANPAPAADTVNVTVKYTGKGVVDATHKLWVWLFDTPDIGAGSMPIAEMALDKNGGTVSFPNVTIKQVYVAVAYDEKGGFNGQAPPPPGSPIAIYGVKAAGGAAAAITPGPKAAVTITFADAQRMQ